MRRCRDCSWWQPPAKRTPEAHGVCTDPDCPRTLTAPDAECDRRPLR